MTEPVTPEEKRDLGPEPTQMPRWVPLLIGVVLVAIAALAVFTGLRYRSDDGTLTDQIGGRKTTTRQTAAPPGEPDAGGSVVLPGSTPSANTPVTGDARAVITGGAAGVHSQVRIWARRGMVLNVLPDDAMVYVNDMPIGDVRQFNSMDEAYEFPEPGSYTIKIAAPDHRERQYVVTVAENAPNDVARISAKLER
jgi:hypothetical protein